MSKSSRNQEGANPPHQSGSFFRKTKNFPEPSIVPRSSHNISRELIDPDALNVLYHLKRRGYKAYLVGGCVRDILLHLKPKDFDVCTDASPSRVRKIFRNCRLIGRRFRLAHIIFKGNKIIEVSTFRREPDFSIETEDRRDLTIHSNKYYGTPADDAWRRDFTINALFYNISDFSIIDYVRGMDDLRSRLIRVIGDPEKRFYEDPVRMMRGIEFSARLGFDLEAETLEGIKRCRGEIRHGSPARMKEEIMAILQGGHACGCFSLFFDTGLFPFLFPDFQPWDESQTKYILAILGQLDSLAATGEKPSEHLCLAAFMWPFIANRLEKEEIRHVNGLDFFLRDHVNPFCSHFYLSVHNRHLIKELYRAVWRMRRGTGNKGEVRLIRKDFFPEAMTLFRLLGKCGQVDQGLVDGWEERIKVKPKHRRRPWWRHRAKNKVTAS